MDVTPNNPINKLYNIFFFLFTGVELEGIALGSEIQVNLTSFPLTPRYYRYFYLFRGCLGLRLKQLIRLKKPQISNLNGLSLPA